MKATPIPLARSRALPGAHCFVLSKAYVHEYRTGADTRVRVPITTVWIVHGMHGWEIWGDIFGDASILIRDEISESEYRFPSEVLREIGYEVVR